MHSSEFERILTPLFDGTPYELFGVEYITGGHKPCLRIYIDKQGGIGIDDIGKMSREISIFLDAEAGFNSAYTLEVSSPGLDRPLFKPSHYQAQVGNEISIKLQEAVADRKKYKGQLVSAGENTFELLSDGEKLCFSYHAVEKAKLVPHYQFKAKSERQNDE